MAPISLLRSSTSASNHSSSASTSAAVMASASAASKNVPTPASSVRQQANNQATVGGGGVGSMVLNNHFSHSKFAIKPCTSSSTVRSSPAAVIPSHLPINLPRPPPPDAAARLLRNASNLNYCSSGSNHEPSSMCLAAMVHDFLEEESDGSVNAGDHFNYNFVQARGGACGLARCNCVDGVCSDVESGGCGGGHDEASDQSLHQGAAASGITKSIEQLCEILEGVSTSSVSPTKRPELALLFEVAKAIEMETEDLMAVAGEGRGSMEKQSMDDASRDDNSSNSSLMNRLRRPVMRRLRYEGYNAAVCKSRWSHRDGVPAGDYEYIDVILESPERSAEDQQKSGKKSERLIVDIDFRAQFEIARASAQYTQLLGVLPRIFVGKVERLKQILKIMCDAAKRSLKEQGLHMPPWRKLKYLQAKWFSAYRRTTNADTAGQTPVSVSVSAAGQKPVSVSEEECNDRHHEIHESRLPLAGCRGSAYRVFSTAFTKEMDMVFFNSKATRPGTGTVSTTTIATVVCTDWELPALEKKKPARNAAPSATTTTTVSSTCSGLSKALKTLVSTNVLL